MRHRHVTAGPAGRMLADAAPEPYWLDRPERPAARSRLVEAVEADLVVVGGGFTGLWAAVQAAEERPGRAWCCWRPTGSPTERGPERRVLRRQPDPRAGQRARAVRRGAAHPAADGPGHVGRDRGSRAPATGSTATSSAVGELDVAVADWQVEDLAEEHRLARRLGLDWRLLDREQTRPRSPRRPISRPSTTPTAWPWSTRPGWPGAWRRRRSGSAYASVEHSPATGLRRDGAGVVVTTPHGQVRADAGAAGHRGRAAAAALHRRLRGSGLGLRADDRTPGTRRTRRPRVGQAAGDRRRRQQIPLLPAHAAPPRTSGGATALRRVRRALFPRRGHRPTTGAAS